MFPDHETLFTVFIYVAVAYAVFQALKAVLHFIGG